MPRFSFLKYLPTAHRRRRWRRDFSNAFSVTGPTGATIVLK